MLKRALEGGNVSLDYRENEDGIDAVNEVKSYEAGFDAIFMDNTMINCDGPEACRQIRALGYRNFIIGVTGNVLEDDIRYFPFISYLCAICRNTSSYLEDYLIIYILADILPYRTHSILCVYVYCIPLVSQVFQGRRCRLSPSKTSY